MKIIHTPLTSHRIGKIKYHNALTQVHCFVLVFFLDHSRINGGCDEEGNLSKVGTLMDLWLAPFQAKTCNSQIPSISYPLLKRKEKKNTQIIFSVHIYSWIVSQWRLHGLCFETHFCHYQNFTKFEDCLQNTEMGATSMHLCFNHCMIIHEMVFWDDDLKG